MQNTNPKQLRSELKEFLDIASKEPIRIQRRNGENFILIREETYQELNKEILMLHRRLLSMSQIVSGEVSDWDFSKEAKEKRILNAMERYKDKK